MGDGSGSVGRGLVGGRLGFGRWIFIDGELELTGSCGIGMLGRTAPATGVGTMPPCVGGSGEGIVVIGLLLELVGAEAGNRAAVGVGKEVNGFKTPVGSMGLAGAKCSGERGEIIFPSSNLLLPLPVLMLLCAVAMRARRGVKQ